LADTILEAVGVNMPAWRMDDAQNVALMNAAVSAGFLTAEQIADLRSLGQRTVSRAVALGLSVVDAAEIARVRNG
jgi:Zn-dependent alcohol dehydrogenase